MEPIRVERYFWPKTKDMAADDPAVRRNRLGIRDSSRLEQVQATIVAEQTQLLPGAPVPIARTVESLQAVHAFLYGRLYEWAGEFRISGGCQCFPGKGCSNPSRCGSPMPWWHLTTAVGEVLEDPQLDPDALCVQLLRLDPFWIGSEATVRAFCDRLSDLGV